jgi:hypothetical protein
MSQYSFDLGQAIAQALTPPLSKRRRLGNSSDSEDDVDDEGHVAQAPSTPPAVEAASWEGLESSAMKRMREQGDGLEIEEDILEGVPNMYTEMSQFKSSIVAKYENWSEYSPTVRNGIVTIEFSLAAIGCDWKAALFRTKFVTLTLLNTMRAHEDGAVHKEEGAWLKITEFPRVALVQLEEACKAGVALLLCEMTVLEQAHENKQVTSALKGLADLPGLDDAMAASLATVDLVVASAKGAGWVKSTAKALYDLIPKWSTSSDSEYSHFCRWAFCPRPPQNGVIAFKDCTLEFKDGAIKQVKKADAADCYVLIPAQLSYRPSDDYQAWFRRFLTTCVAGNTEALFLEMAIESLALFGKPLPHHLVFYYGSGGNSKGARSKLRANTFGSGHAWVSPSVFDMALRDEFRKQGTDFYGAMLCTLREADGFELDEKIFRAWTAGEGVGCRLPHGVHTPMLAWPTTGKFWEINTQNTPVIRSLKENSFTRRLIGIEKRAVFTSREEEVDPTKLVFLADPDLETKLDAADAVYCYLRSYLFPFIKEHSEADAKTLIMKPTPQIQADTKKLLQIMADNQKYKSFAHAIHDKEEAADPMEADDGKGEPKPMLQKLHETYQTYRVVMDYQILKNTDVPGLSTKSSRKGKKTRLEAFLDALQQPSNFFFDKITANSFARAPYKSWSLFENLDAEKFGDMSCWKSYQGRAKHPEDESMSSWTDVAPQDDADVENEVQIMECAHLANLQHYHGLAIDRRPAELDKFLALVASGEDIGNGVRSFPVMYHRVASIPGRQYARGPSLQTITREARGVAVNGLCTDLDFTNSHVTSLRRTLERMGLQGAFPMIERFAEHFEDWRAFWGKKSLIKILYGGIPSDEAWNPVTWTLAAEIQDATDKILAHSDYQYLQGRFNDRPRPKVTKLYYALAADEDARLMAAVETCKEAGCVVRSLLFDGVLVQGDLPDLGRLCGMVQKPLPDWKKNFFMRLKAAGSESDVLVEKHENSENMCIWNALANVGDAKAAKVAQGVRQSGPHTYACVQMTLATKVKLGGILELGSARDVEQAKQGDKFLLHWESHCAGAVLSQNQSWCISDDSYEKRFLVPRGDLQQLLEQFDTVFVWRFKAGGQWKSGAAMPDEFYMSAGCGKENELKSFRPNVKKCLNCHSKVKIWDSRPPTTCKLIGSEGVEDVLSFQAQCTSKSCLAVYRPNFMWSGATKLNTLKYSDFCKVGAYFVSNKVAFTLPYLQLCRLRLLRARVAPGQEAGVQHLFHEGDGSDLQCEVSLRDNLLHAVEGLALAMRTPSELVRFNLDFPASIYGENREDFLFPPPMPVTALSFDGHFGVHRLLDPKVDPPREKALVGRPKGSKNIKKGAVGGCRCRPTGRLVKKSTSKPKRSSPTSAVTYYQDYERSIPCTSKAKQRRALPNHTAGWQFVLDAVSKRCLGAKEHLQNELMTDKTVIVKAVMKMPKVSPNLLIHDSCCFFEKHVKKYDAASYKSVKHFVIDRWHCKNHKCKKRTWTAAESRRMRGIPDSISESFNAWIRPFNFFLNGLRPASHRFWVKEVITYYNEHVQGIMKKPISRRTTAESRARAKK